MSDAKKALAGACARLGLPGFSQRAIRRVLIQRLWKAGVDKKLIAKWQGHSDGGKLILDTYTEAFGSDDDKYEQQELAKIA
jgi:integrase